MLGLSKDKIISGEKIAEKHREALKVKRSEISKKISVNCYIDPHNESSVRYTQLKEAWAERFDIMFHIIGIAEYVSKDEFLEMIQKANESTNVEGIIIQLPIHSKFQDQESKLLNSIDPKKDIDGLRDDSHFLPAVVRGVLSILEDLGTQDVTLERKEYGVVGSEGMVGSKMVKALENQKRKIIKIDSKLEDTSLDDLKECDVVISCVGKEGLVKSQHIKDGVILIDVGLGDFDPECYQKASKYTPKVGGVGPMTIIALMENIVEAVTRQI